MASCETCGNEYDKAFEVKMGARRTSLTRSSALLTRSRPSAATAA